MSGTVSYRLAPDIRIISQEKGGLAICSYPLRALRLGSLTTRILLECRQERSCEELARSIDLPVTHIEAICDQLRWKGLLEAGPMVPPATWPGVSIIIPTHNRAAQLERCLTALLKLDYPAQCLELVVVDDASSDETASMVQRFAQEAAHRGIAMQVVRHTTQKGVAQGRNTGAGAAHHELLAYLDSDCIASPGWLAELVPAFQNPAIGAVGGMIRAYERRSMLGRYEDVRSSLFMGVRPQRVRLEGPLMYLPTANLLVRRAVWQRLAGFALLDFGEDVDFCRRLLTSGSQIIYLPQGIVYHDYRIQLTAFLRTRISYASAEAVLLDRYPAGRRILILPPEQAMFAGLAIGGIWNSLGRRRRIAPTTGDAGSTKMGESHRPPGADTSVLPTINRGLRGAVLMVFWLLVAGLFVLVGAYVRWRKVRRQKLPLGLLAILQATLRGYLAYTYHLCRHLARYYTLPLLIAGLLCPPILLLAFIMCGIVIGVDYVRLQPRMSVFEFAFCSLLDDCAYEVGVVLGCIKHKNWKPLIPIVKSKHPGSL